jgi:uncharacterized protein (DUF433 family)
MPAHRIKSIGNRLTQQQPKKAKRRGKSVVTHPIQNRPFARPYSQSNFRFLQRKLSFSPQHIKEHLEIDSRIKHGNPVFKGTRVPVYVIVEELADGTMLEDIVEGYPTLNIEQVKAGLDFVASLARIYDDQVSD